LLYPNLFFIFVATTASIFFKGRMNDIIKSANINLRKLENEVPVRLDVDILQEAAEHLMYKALIAMEDIIDTSDRPDAKIKAFNSTINCGRYLERRRENINNKPQRIVIDSKYRIQNDGVQEER